MPASTLPSPAVASSPDDPARSLATDSPSDLPGAHLTVIEPTSGWRLIDFRELYQYRDMLWFLTWRSVKVLYAQSAIGIGWAVIQPLFSMIIFTVVFGHFAQIDSNGVPYSVFSLTALVPWTYFANSLLEAGNSLVNQAQMISKVYFPRVVLPLSGVLAKLVDFAIASTMLACMMAFYRIMPNFGVIALPLLVLIMLCSAMGLGLWLTALAVQYRDVKHALNFVVQLLMYATPVVYPASIVPFEWQTAYALNPMVGVIEGFRSALLGTRPMPWDWIALGACSSVALLLSGLLYFRRQERVFADVA